MNDNDLKMFVEGSSHYFNTVSQKPASIGAPFLIKDINKYLSDYTGIISISGNFKGCVFFSAPKNMLIKLLSTMEILTPTHVQLMDTVGEVSNTIAGNARREFGDKFMLSTPILLEGKSKRIKTSKIEEVYVIPIIWYQHQANLIINIENN